MKPQSIGRKILLTILLACGSSGFTEGGRTGNAGDWRRIMISAAQREAANWTNTAALNLDAVENWAQISDNELVVTFLKHPHSLVGLAFDIASSRHIYLSEDDPEAQSYTTCAWTNDPSAASLSDIVFTLPLCDGGLLQGGQVFANRTAIHESTHHLLRAPEFTALIKSHFKGSSNDIKTQEEAFCDEVAESIHKIFDAVALRNKPHWRDIALPVFSEESDASLQMLDARGFHATAWTGATGDASTAERLIVWGGCHEGSRTLYACGGDSYFNDGAIYSPADDSWVKIEAAQAPSPRAKMLSLWTGPAGSRPNELLIWGGCFHGDGCDQRLNDGGFYNPASRQWTAIAGIEAVAPRIHHGGVWTGNQLIVWGGHPKLNPGDIFLPAPLADGGVYDPRSGWRPIDANLLHAPTARAFPAAIWTGETGNPETADRMLIWGGCLQEIGDTCTGLRNDGALFDPRTMAWEALQTRGVMPAPRHHASILHVPSQAKLYVFGGIDASGRVLPDGGILDLKSLTWTPMATTAAGRFKHTAAWAGDRMMVFGGKVYNDGTRSYELAADVDAYVPSPLPNRRGTWTRYKTQELTPLKAIEHSAIWTGESLIVWGGQIFDRGFTASGSRFFPGQSSP